MISLYLVFVLLVTSSLTFCQSLPPNCKSGAIPGDCFSCESGYVLAKNSTSGYQRCYGCSPGCQSCQNAGPTKCDTCSQGYTLLNPSQTCSPFAANCTKCDVARGGQCDPGSCQQGFGTMTSLTSNTTICQACSSSACVSCSSSFNFCDTCPPGFFLSTSATYSTCESCNGYLQYCQNCLNGQTCTACLYGYTFNAQTKTCAVPTYTVTNSTGVIVSVVVCLTFAVVLGVLAFYRGKKVALANK